MKSAACKRGCGVRRHDCALERRDMSRWGKAATCCRSPNFSDKNWVGIGLNWVCFHFLKKSKLVKSSMFERLFTFFELGSFSRFCVFNQRDAGPHEGNEECRGPAGFLARNLAHGDFSMATSADREVF